MKALIFSALIMLCQLFSMAQQIEQGKVYTDDRKFNIIKLSGISRGYLTLIKGRTDNDELIKDLRIEWYDTASMERPNMCVLEGCFSNRQEFFPEGVITFNDKVYALGSKFDKSSMENVLLLKELIVENGKDVLGPSVELMRVKTAFFSFFEKRFQTFTSNSGNRLLVAHAGNPGDSDSLLITTKLFDTALNVVKSGNQTVTKLSAQYKIDQIAVDESDNIFVLMHWARSGKAEQKSYYLYAFPSLGTEVVEFNLDTDEYRNNDLRFTVSKGGYLRLAGLYYPGKRKETEEPIGILFLEVDLNGSEINRSGVLTFNELLGSPKIKEQLRNDELQTEHIHLTDIGENENGRMRIYLEHQSSEEICETDFRSNMMQCSMHYYTGNVLIVEMNDQGRTDSVYCVLKNQHMVDEGMVYLSYLTLGTENEGRFLCYLRDFKDKEQNIFTNFDRCSIALSEIGKSRVVDFEADLPVNINAGAIQCGKRFYFSGENRSGTCLYRFSDWP
ncbi:MAG: hypothetical protein ACK5CY_11715 [Bacteroidia bacterium]